MTGTEIPVNSQMTATQFYAAVLLQQQSDESANASDTHSRVIGFLTL